METLAASGTTRIERIVSRGHQSAPDDWYDQAQHEWVLLVQGQARLQFEDHILHLSAGDHVNIPAHCKHRVTWTTPDQDTVWLAVFY
ncbi:cupin domain-containing protein [Rhodoferax sp.]|uniref:cupin domain-containing protein n=1 Tax=Rhodoferax sp. TaxID=50421 RepID=UPI0026065727|nr:cupin domain-containing protein [Rhodoferax sp.]MDD2923900.1 cupin domain-containing protein [Rhodoferax sp.]